MKKINLIGLLLLLLVISGCDSDKDGNRGIEIKIDSSVLCVYLSSGDMDGAMSVVNEFLAALPQRKDMYSQKVQSFVAWLNSTPSILHAYSGGVTFCARGIQKFGFIFKENDVIKSVRLGIPMVQMVLPWRIHGWNFQEDVSFSADCEVDERLIRANGHFYFYEDNRLFPVNLWQLLVKLKPGEELGEEFEVVSSNDAGLMTINLPNWGGALYHFCRLKETGKFEVVELLIWE